MGTSSYKHIPAGTTRPGISQAGIKGVRGFQVRVLSFSATFVFWCFLFVFLFCCFLLSPLLFFLLCRALLFCYLAWSPRYLPSLPLLCYRTYFVFFVCCFFNQVVERWNREVEHCLIRGLLVGAVCWLRWRWSNDWNRRRRVHAGSIGKLTLVHTSVSFFFYSRNRGSARFCRG